LINYLEPALKSELIERTQPDSPRSPTQKYRLTEKGKLLLARKQQKENKRIKKQVK
jgi:ATP-dependent DNA helicase RecG